MSPSNTEILGTIARLQPLWCHFIPVWVVVLVFASSSQFCLAQSLSPSVPKSDLADQVRAVFKKRCVTCHSLAQARGDLDMSTHDSILAGSASGDVVVPGNPEASLLFQLASHQDNPKMPPNAPQIPKRELNTIYQWIASLATSPAVHLSTSAKPEYANLDDVKTENSTKDNDLSGDVKEGLSSVRTLSGKAGITGLAISPISNVIAVSGLRQILLLNLESREWIGGLEFPEGQVFAIRFTSDGKKLFAAGGQAGKAGAIVGWNTDSFQRFAKIDVDRDSILAMDCSPDGRFVAVGGPQRTVQVFQVDGGKELFAIKKHTDWITALSFSPDGLLLASGDRFGGMSIWEVPTGNEYFSKRGHTDMITDLQWSIDSNRCVSSARDGFLQIWDMTTGSSQSKWMAHAGGVEAVQWIKDEWVSTGQDKSVTFWSQAESPRSTREFSSYGTEMAVSRQSQIVIVADTQGSLHLFPFSPESQLAHINLPYRAGPYLADIFGPRKIDRGRMAESHDRVATVSTSQSTVEAELEKPKSNVATPPRTLLNSYESDLLESKLALETAQHALRQAYLTAEALEESVARLKQIIALQEARASQARIRSSMDGKNRDHDQ